VGERDWDQLDLLRQRCRLVLERGKQLWAVAAYIEYRLCLEAPGPWAARTLETGSGRFALGPLPEVASSSHTWAELAPYLQGTPQAAMAAHERVVRGEDLSKDVTALSLPAVLDLPLRLADWEPRYPLAEYGPDEVSAPAPALPPLEALPVLALPVLDERRDQDAAAIDAPGREVISALEELAANWTTESNGRAEAVAVAGGAVDAVRALGARPVQMVQLSSSAALAQMAWAAATGGAHGRRRGAAAGRFGAWSVLAALSGRGEDWAANEIAFCDAAISTRWYAWANQEPVTGWALHLALETAGPSVRAFALAAVDAF